jgi:phosphoglycolate phosphatase-like HAD superfamily hydrolase
MINLDYYQTIIFDCDGVILNSNFQKIKAYRNAALEFGATNEEANQLVKHHTKLTGVSRNIKFKYFLSNILCQEVTEKKMSDLIQSLNNNVIKLLKHCEVAEGLKDLKVSYPKNKWIVASGGAQDELRYLFSDKKIDHYFTEGIYGSPRSKHEIIEHELKDKSWFPALFIGDSLYDIKTAKKYDIDFLFVSDWTDLEDWEVVCKEYNVPSIKRLSELLS